MPQGADMQTWQRPTSWVAGGRGWFSPYLLGLCNNQASWQKSQWRVVRAGAGAHPTGGSLGRWAFWLQTS